MAKPRKTYFPLMIWGTLIILCVLLYFFFDPNQQAWMPKCPLRLLTGWNCPACGLQRATHALLHGRFVEALTYNYFIVIFLPYLLLLFVAEILKVLRRGRIFIRTVEHPVVTKVFFAQCLIWGVIRNFLQV